MRTFAARGVVFSFTGVYWREDTSDSVSASSYVIALAGPRAASSRSDVVAMCPLSFSTTRAHFPLVRGKRGAPLCAPFRYHRRGRCATGVLLRSARREQCRARGGVARYRAVPGRGGDGRRSFQRLSVIFRSIFRLLVESVFSSASRSRRRSRGGPSRTSPTLAVRARIVVHARTPSARTYSPLRASLSSHRDLRKWARSRSRNPVARCIPPWTTSPSSRSSTGTRRSRRGRRNRNRRSARTWPGSSPSTV